MSRGVRQDELPPAEDPIWQVWADGVLVALSKPKTIDQLKAWAHEEDFEVGKLINALAWLDMRGLIGATRVDGALVWRRTLPKPKPVLKVAPKVCPKCRGLMHIEPERVRCLNCGCSVYPPPDQD